MLVTKNQESEPANSVIHDLLINTSVDNTKNIPIKTEHEHTTINIESCNESSQKLNGCNNLETGIDNTSNSMLVNISVQVCILLKTYFALFNKVLNRY